MSIYKDGGEYTCSHFWWDGDENEFLFTATWVFEHNYPEMPDHWYLEDVELESWNLMTPDRENELIQYVKEMSRRYGPVWCDIESEGPYRENLQEVDYT